ncbi:glycine cleavage system protein GcvH [Anaeromassilibacillus senegalensis]|uniref:glycine cleavage system protein GcvH n=1 Tax=Anaeromassilibacillus senegalensis TaxID=1673717 RepID=UPI000681D9F8|nr:glycine cleavage system protein GcvH [Anaeromassilibacillus senegalensis]
MNIPENLLYLDSHEWVEKTGEKTARIGLTDFAQDQLGDLVFVNLPEEGDSVAVGESFADVESVKAVSDIYSPVTGTVAAINADLLDAPEAINQDPYGAWLIEVTDITEYGELMDAVAYQAFCEEQN